MNLEQLPQGNTCELQAHIMGQQARAEGLESLLAQTLEEIRRLGQQLAQTQAEVTARDALLAQKDEKIAQLEMELQEERDNHNPFLSQTRSARMLQTVMDEGLIRFGTQWYAINRFLIEEMGFPPGPKEFCERIDEMNLQTQVPCLYENWRKVGSECPRLAVRVSRWKDIAPEITTDKERSQIDIVRRLYELKSSQSSQKSMLGTA